MPPLFQKRHVFNALFGLFGAIVFVYIFSGRDLTFLEFFTICVDTFLPRSHVNFIIYPKFFAISLGMLVYIAFLISIFPFSGYHLFKAIKGSSGISLSAMWSDFIKHLLMFVICITCIQGAIHVLLVTVRYEAGAYLTADERYEEIFGDTYRFAQFCKQYIDPTKTVEYMTDLDLENDPGQFLHRLSAYLLYPIDMRNIRGERKDNADYIIFFIKNYDPTDIPDGYALHAQYSKNAYILIRI